MEAEPLARGPGAHLIDTRTVTLVPKDAADCGSTLTTIILGPTHADKGRRSAMRVRDISVRGRHRHEMGDVAGLAQTIAARGLLHPIVVRPDGRLIVGERRLAAVKSL